LKPKRISQPTAVGTLIDRLFSAEKSSQWENLANAWQQVAGEPVAKYSQAARIEAGVLIVRVAAPIWATQIRMSTPTLVAKMATAGFEEITEIRIKVLASWPPEEVD